MPDVAEQLELITRGAVELHEKDDLAERLKTGRPLRVKTGFDPTRPDLHLGHTVLMQKMRQFQDLGHEVIFLIGDFTAMVGDPTGQNDSRPRLTRPEVLAAAETYKTQAFKVLDESKTIVRYNSEWLGQMPLDEVIGLAAKRTLARTLERRDFRDRFNANKDIYLHELFYPLLQGYDSVALEADIELGGTDQLFNLMVGRDLMQRSGMKPQMVLTLPILEGTDARVDEAGKVVGKKMSKSAGNTIGINDSPGEMFRKCMQIDDQVIWRFFDLLSARSKAELEEYAQLNPLDVKKAFADEMVERFHDAQAAVEARQHFDRIHMADGVPDDIAEVEVGTEGPTLALSKALSSAMLVKSSSEGRRMIVQGGVLVDGERVVDGQHQLQRGGRYLLRVGSKKRKFSYVTVPR